MKILIPTKLDKAAAATLMTLSHGFDAAANQFNVKKEKKKKEKPAEQEGEAQKPAEESAPEQTQG